MARTKISEFSATPGNNTDIDSINIAENCAPSGINDAIRELMAQLKDFQTGAVGDSFNGPVGTTTAAAGAFTTLAASGAVTLSGGTANGVTYLNGSKVLTSGSALTFDGTNVGIGTSSPAYKLDVNGAANFGANVFHRIGGTPFVATSGGFTYYYGNTNGVAWRNAADNTTQMALDSSGNLGLGVTPSAWRSTYKASQVGNATAVVGRTDNNNNYFSSNWYVNTSNQDIYQNTGFATLYSQGTGTHTWYSAPSGTAGNAISFTQAMTLDASGNLLVGTLSAGTYFGIRVEGVLAATGVQSRSGVGGSFGGNRFNTYWTGSAAQLWVDTSNLGTISVSSDYRIKKNIEDQTAPALERVMRLRPVTYELADYGDLFKADGVLREGFIAHEVQEVIPSGAEGHKDQEDRVQNLRLDAILSVAVKAIQEQQALILTLQADVAALKAAA